MDRIDILGGIAGIGTSKTQGALRAQEQQQEDLAMLLQAHSDKVCQDSPGEAFAQIKGMSDLESVELEYVPGVESQPSFKLKFKVREVCVREQYISLLLAGDVGFQPECQMKFKLRYQDQQYFVIFLGAEFEFKSIDAKGISFLMDAKHNWGS